MGSRRLEHKIAKCDEIIASNVENKNPDSMWTLPIEPLDNCPITMDKTVWEAYEKKHPTTISGGDTEGAAMGIDRTPYFDAFFEKVKASKWTCYASAQIPGFDTWLADDYHSAILYDGAAGVEDWVFEWDNNPYEAVSFLTESANKTYREFKAVLE